jgi:hypothetical protein
MQSTEFIRSRALHGTGMTDREPECDPAERTTADEIDQR